MEKSFRVYDDYEKHWANGEFCLSNLGDLFKINKTMFGKDKLELLSSNRYITHKYIGACDKYGTPIYEGDICRNTEDNDIEGVVAYSEDHASYYVFDNKYNAYYGLVEANREEMVVVGNVFDGVKEEFELDEVTDIEPTEVNEDIDTKELVEQEEF